MIQLQQAQKDHLKALMEESSNDFKSSSRQSIKKPATKISAMEYWRSKSLNIRWQRLSNTPAWAEKSATSQTLQRTGRLNNGTRW